MNRLILGFRTFWNVLTRGDFAARAERLFEPESTGPDLRVLAVLQRDGRLIDFLMEEIDGYSNDQIGAAVRDIHRRSRKALADYVTLEPVMTEAEDSPVTIPSGFDPATIRLTGNVNGSPPFHGTLKHHGWRVKAVQLPALPASGGDPRLLAPAEVEVS